jgi:hypothetical protein
MKNSEQNRERGGAGIKFLFVFIVIILIANAGYNYVPVAYNGASLRQDMDTAVVKALGAPGQLKSTDVLAASLQKAVRDNDIPPDAIVEIKPAAAALEAHVSYTKKVPVLPFGLYNYNYDFDYTARPVGYLLKQ